jgi:hypothetical protein
VDFNKIAQIAKEINKQGIRWAVGASVMLYFHGLIDNPNDLDILVHESDAEQLDELLKKLGVRSNKEYKETFATKYFYNYMVEGIEIDLIGGFIINHAEGKYKLTFDSDTIVEFKVINGINIPLSSLEDWYVIYQLIPNREHRTQAIEKYLLENKVKNPYLLERALEKDLPSSVKERARNILNA